MNRASALSMEEAVDTKNASVTRAIMCSKTDAPRRLNYNGVGVLCVTRLAKALEVKSIARRE